MDFPAEKAVAPTYAIRSLDNGKTWQDLQKLHDDWTGAIRDIIETRDGNIVFTSMMMRHNPGRHSVVTYTSNDEGKRWLHSNLIDLGGIEMALCAEGMVPFWVSVMQAVGGPLFNFKIVQ